MKVYFDTPIDAMGFTVRTHNSLKNMNIKTLGELLRQTEEKCLRTRNFGKKCVDEIKAVLSGMNLKLGMTDLPKQPCKVLEMTIRDYFAGQALAGFLANIERSGSGETSLTEGFAIDAYQYADAMLKIREER